jgi:hypothetical protein
MQRGNAVTRPSHGRASFAFGDSPDSVKHKTMLPILRIIPVGGVCLAVLILLLAISPPRETRRGASPEMVLARGPLIDRRQHPEWPQFLMQAAFRRAGEVLSLRDLPDTPTRIAPVALPPERPVMAAAPAPQAPSVSDAAVAAEPQAKPAEPAEPQIEQNAVSTPVMPSPASEGPITRTATLSVDVDNMKSAPAAAAPTPAQADSAPPQALAPAVTPAPPAAVDTSTRVAVLPVERPATDPDPDDVTNSIDAASGSTIPVDIGETSSTELPIVLPRERPPILSTRGRNSRVLPHKRPVRHAKSSVKPRAKPAVAANLQPASEVNLFESLFGNTGADASRASPRSKGAKGVSTSGKVPPYPPTEFYPFPSK